MMNLLYRQCSRSARLLFTVYISTVLVTAAGGPLQADDGPDTHERFVELDSEIQAIKVEILAINRDILLLEELSLYPYDQQLVVLVSVANGSTINPEHLSLQLDGQAVTQHDYSPTESAALQEGGVHRLYTGGLSEGEHRLDISLTGRQARDKAFKHQSSITITKMPGRKTMELHLDSGEGRSEPGVTIRQWQQ